MANKDLFKQAIAEAKSVREAAIANAKEALEETLTPHLKDMLAAKLQEMEDSTVEEEVVNEVEEEIEEAKDDKKEEAKEEVSENLEEVEIAEEDEAEVDSEESEDEAEDEIEDAGEEEGELEVEDEIDGDEDLSKLSVDQFKDMIRDIIAQEVGGDAPADDMDAGDIEGIGDEAPIDEPAIDAPAEDEDEIDLDELIKELDGLTEEEVEEGKKKEDDTMEEGEEAEEETVEEDVTANSTANQESADHSAEGTNINRTVNEESSDLEAALETIETLKKELNEVNILNAKLLYVNKIFKAQNLTESQKVNVIAAFDKAETVKEVKLVYETVADNVGTKKETTIKEHKGSASKATGTTASKPEVIAEVSDAVRRMQKLAGIIK
jgi:hypothetical protein